VPTASPPAKTAFLDFEQPIADLDAMIEELRFVQGDSPEDSPSRCARRPSSSHGASSA